MFNELKFEYISYVNVQLHRQLNIITLRWIVLLASVVSRSG